MAKIDDLTMRIEQLEIENKRLKSQLKFANKEIHACHKTIDRYQKMIDDESEHFSRLAKDMKMYSDNIQELYEQGK